MPQYHRPPPVLGADPDRPDAVALVGEPAAGGHRGHDQRHPGHRLRPRRHPRGPGRVRVRPAAARAADAVSTIVPRPRRSSPGSRRSSASGMIGRSTRSSAPGPQRGRAVASGPAAAALCRVLRQRPAPPGGPVLVRNEDGGTPDYRRPDIPSPFNRLPGSQSARTVTQGLSQEPGPTVVGWVQPTDVRPLAFGGLHPPYKSGSALREPPVGARFESPSGGDGTGRSPRRDRPGRTVRSPSRSWCAAGASCPPGTCSRRRVSGTGRGTRC